MAKADLLLPDGTKVTIDGTADEITKILASVGQQQATEAGGKQVPGRGARRSRRGPGREPSISRANGPRGLILQLRESGYFKGQTRSLNDIRKKLEEEGHIFPRTSLSPALVGLVRQKQLRRVKTGQLWAYTSST